MAADLAIGKPLVVHVHVPLCSNEIIWCGNERLGNGDDPDKNPYWASSGGFRGWFGRRGSGWKLVHRGPGADRDVLEVMVWKQRVAPDRAWRERGTTPPGRKNRWAPCAGCSPIRRIRGGAANIGDSSPRSRGDGLDAQSRAIIAASTRTGGRMSHGTTG